MKYAIFYFSPCGGTKSVADIISKELGDAPMQELTTPSMNTAIDHDTLTFFCFPVYGGRIPKPMYDRMKIISGDKTPCVPVAVFGNRAVDDALLGLGRELLDARNLGGEGAGAHQAEEPGHVDLGVIRLGGFVGDGEERQRSRSLMRFPDGFHGGDLGRLVLRDEVAGFVAHLDGHQGGDHAEDGGEAEGGAGELQVLTAEHVVGGDGHHEDSACLLYTSPSPRD